MDLKGAEVRNFYHLTNDMGGGSSLTTERVKIPHYQRPFKWDKRLVGQLIEDWDRENKRNDGGEYFAGSIVTVINAGNEDRIHQLIDGQQRYTTIYLVNYFLFLLLRVTLRQAIKQSEQLEITKLLEQLETSLKYSFIAGEIDSLLNIAQVNAALTNNEASEKKKILDKYLDDIKLPRRPEGDNKYSEKYTKKLKEYINNNVTPRLSYDRVSYNVSLVNALSRVIVTLSDQAFPYVKIDRNGLKKGCVEEVYLDAVDQIYESFYGIGRKLSKLREEKNEFYKKNTFNVSLSIIDSLVSFLANVKLCVIQTGNQKDAYTLFEVLNDRSLALDDLDLIKNQFYRHFCEKCDLKDEEIDTEINKREEQWGDEIFGNNSDSNKKLIAYLATSYITGSTSIGLKSHDIHRDAIKEYLDTCQKYSKNDLATDFNIFQTVKILVDKFEIVTNKRDAKAIEAEFKKNHTITYKTVHLLLALGYEGVLAGLINYILQSIKVENQKHSKDVFDLSDIEVFVKCLVTDNNKYKDIHEQAKIIWQYALMTEDYRQPRELAKSIITISHKGTTQLIIQQVPLDANDLRAWLKPWRYRNSNIKVRILFARLLQLTVHGENLTSDIFTLNITDENSRNLHLDHMEPNNPDPTKWQSYYKYGSIERDDDVNALGNMFPLPGNINISKGNDPMYTVFSRLTDSGLKGHGLTIETKKLFKNNCENINGIDVPTQKFFTKRKEYLIKMFSKAIRL